MLIVRQTLLDDIDAILRIMQEPNVVRLQYRADLHQYSEFLHRVLCGDNETGIFTTQFSTIERGGTPIGYIRHDHYSIDGVKMVSCSWNLSSNYWGHGIMKGSLTQLIDEWVHGTDVQHIFADHFRNNLRCKRLLDRLGFIFQEIPLLERLTIAFQFHCLQWVVRRRLDAKIWKSVTQLPIDNPMEQSDGSAAS